MAIKNDGVLNYIKKDFETFFISDFNTYKKYLKEAIVEVTHFVPKIQGITYH